ncbi:MAG: VanW family protein [Actinobacteria bacterium]|nr:VanW family protein [Actinomycetota bacterium]
MKPGLFGLATLLAVALAVGVGYAGSSEKIADGVTVAGVDVGGRTTEEAQALLAARGKRAALEPVTFTAAGGRWSIAPAELDTRVQWARAAEEARAAGEWPLPVRGLKRAYVATFGVDVTPHATVDETRLAAKLGVIAAEVDNPARHAALELEGLEPAIVPEREGRLLVRSAAKRVVVAAVAGFDRHSVRLPIRVDRPSVTAETLRPVAEQVRTALSAPVRFGWKNASWLVSREQLARLLLLPSGGVSELRIGGAKADRYFDQLAAAIGRKPRDADFAVAADGSVSVVPSRSGRGLDVRASKAALLAGAISPEREATLVVRHVKPELTTARARAMGLEAVMATYITSYSGTADRIHNLQLAIDLLDGTRLRPGETFSMNEVVGPRTEARGFRPAPTILDGEYEDTFGGGVSQVATTLFNVAWEAGLKIAARTAHSLYISRYPLGRDATVSYPEIDLKFVNDTDGWLYVDGSYDAAGISIRLLGVADDRRVVSETGPLEEVAPPEVERVPDRTLFVGEELIEDDGEPQRAVTVTRTVYRDGKVLYAETWRTTYDSEPQIVRVGTKPRPQAETPPPSAPPTATGGTTTTPGTATGTTTTDTTAP